MQDGLLFAFGLVVTLVVIAAVGAIWWAAVQDGRTEEALRRGEPTDLDETAAPASAVIAPPRTA